MRDACDAAGLALVPLVAPTTTDERIADIGRDARGFVYTVSLAGTTGERDELPPELGETVARVREATEVPGGGRLRHLDGRARAPGRGDRRRRDRGQPDRARRGRGRGGGGRRASSVSWRAGAGVGCAHARRKDSPAQSSPHSRGESSAPTSTPSSHATPTRWPSTGPRTGSRRSCPSGSSAGPTR